MGTIFDLTIEEADPYLPLRMKNADDEDHEATMHDASRSVRKGGVRILVWKIMDMEVGEYHIGGRHKSFQSMIYDTGKEVSWSERRSS